MTPIELRNLGIAINGGVRWGWQTALAKRLGVDARTIRNWASGRVKISVSNGIAIMALMVEQSMGGIEDVKE